jgi:hypothetical protein
VKSAYSNPVEPKMEGKSRRKVSVMDNAYRPRYVMCHGCGAKGVANPALLKRGKLLSCVNCR